MRAAPIVVPRESRAVAVSVRVSPIENSVSPGVLANVNTAARCETTIDFAANTVPVRAVIVALPARRATIVVDGPDDGFTLATEVSLDAQEIATPDTGDPDAARASAETVTESGMENNESGTGDVMVTIATGWGWGGTGGVESDPAPHPSAALTIKKI
jgi:hypothetical protein